MLNECLVAPTRSPFSFWKPPAPGWVRQGHFLLGQRQARRAAGPGAGPRRIMCSEGVTKLKELDLGAVLSCGAGRALGSACGHCCLSCAELETEKGPALPGSPATAGTSGSQISSFGSGGSRGASGGWASCIAGQPAPCSPAGGCAAPRQRRCRAGRAAPCPGSGGRLAQLWQRQCRPRQREPCPHPSCELEIGECWRAPAGAVRRAATGCLIIQG
ncbi:uncharacterized protein LOC121664310 [Corvus kubaryi]|uniref:uncharacterized protein LOC121664310 n=1 Tax=Corvus kubaryi TaxID=68294 RepID=UPI001C043E4C|nr:uncharacterized protein LOC121664310 [Corvus kubaryi]